MNLDVQTPAEWLRTLVKPPLESVVQFAFASDDTLVVCGGFEERSIGVLQNAATRGVSFNVLLILYEPFVAENRASAIRDLCGRCSLRVEEVVYDRENPTGFGTALISELSNREGRIYVDISGMSRLLMAQSLVALGSRPKRFPDCFMHTQKLSTTHQAKRKQRRSSPNQRVIRPCLSCFYRPAYSR